MPTGSGCGSAGRSTRRDGGEHRGEIAARYAGGFRQLLERPEETILLVAHSLPIRYVLDAGGGLSPRAKVGARRVRDARPADA